MKISLMKWIIPAVAVAITLLIIFQVRWLFSESERREQEKRKEITDALRAACMLYEKHEAKGFIGNSLDSVFIRTEVNHVKDSDLVDDKGSVNEERIVVIDSNTEHELFDPPPPLPPPLPPGPFAQLKPDDSAGIVILHRSEQIKSAMTDMVMRYAFEVRDPQNRLNAAVMDSLIEAELGRNEINYPYKGRITNRFFCSEWFGDTAVTADSLNVFRLPVFPGLGIPDPMLLEVNIPYRSSGSWMLIVPQIVFAVAVTSLLLLLFVLIYRETLRQKKIGDIRRDFINNMTHEFKTPLASMSLAADTIMNDKVIRDPDKVKYYAEQIKTENRRLNQQVERVLELSLTEKKESTMRFESVNPVSLMQEAIKCMAIQFNSAGGNISLNGDLSEHRISADSFHLERVFVNLLDNALKYGGKPPVASINVCQYRGGIEFHIKDNGRGINRSEWKTIFQPFYRIPTGDVHNVKGFGLGLSYAKSVVDLHGGSLYVAESDNSGTKFILVLLDERKA